MQTVLLVDDDPRLAALLREYLEARSFSVAVAGDGSTGLARLRSDPPDIVILDVMLPGKDGFEICKEIRTFSNVPIIMLTARGDETDRIVGLELGADDYLPKPFSPRELLARMRAVLRRGGQPTADDIAIEAAGIRLDPTRREVTVEGVEVQLTTTEFDILRVLLVSSGRVVPRERLMELARGPDFAAFERSVDVHVSHLRRKIGDDPRQPTRLKTVRGVGYMLVGNAR
jgi:two-component system, OmpR family, phosphate regulon response regulator OmpR